MEFNVINFVLIALIALFSYLVFKRNHQNKFHLDYIIVHTFLLLLSASLYKGMHYYLIGIFFFDVI